MAVSKVISFGILISFLNVASSDWSFTKTLRDKALDGNSLFTLNMLTEWQCLFESSNNPKSGSVNYHKERKVCEVNAVVDDNEEIEPKIKAKPGWTYYEKEKKVMINFWMQKFLTLKYMIIACMT